MDWRNLARGEFLRRCRELAGDKKIDNIIWRYEGIWSDVGPQCRNAAIDGVEYRYKEVTESDRRPGYPEAKWKDMDERRRWSTGSQPETALRERAIALAKILPLVRSEYRQDRSRWIHSDPDKCRVCRRETSCYMDEQLHILICMDCYAIHGQ